MEKWSKVLKRVWSFFEIVIIIYVVLMTAFIIFKNKYGYTQIGNYTFYNVDKIGDKNNPRLKKGNLVIIENTDDIKVGDMIYYYAIYDESYIVRSDTVKDITVNGSDTMYVVTHRGEDVSVFDSKVLGKRGRLFHHLGTVLTIVCSRIGFLLLVFLPITAVFLYQVYDFFTVIRREKFDSEDNDDEDNEDDEEPVIIESHETEESVVESNKAEEKKEEDEKKENITKVEVENKDGDEEKEVEEKTSTKSEVEKKKENEKNNKENSTKTEVEEKKEEEKKKEDKKEPIKKEKNKIKDDDIEIL